MVAVVGRRRGALLLDDYLSETSVIRHRTCGPGGREKTRFSGATHQGGRLVLAWRSVRPQPFVPAGVERGELNLMVADEVVRSVRHRTPRPAYTFARPPP